MKRRLRSDYHQIVVHDRAGVRTLRFGDVVQSTMQIDRPSDGGLEYVDFFHMPMILRAGLRRILFIGLGGGSGPTQFLDDYPQVEVDVVEIDPDVVRLAAEMFAFESSSRCRVHVNDGLTFLETTDESWDVIIIDAYMIERGDLVVPRELTTESFFELCRLHLNPHGILVFNSATTADAQLTIEVRDSLSSIFPAILGFESATSDNAVLLASQGSMERRPARLSRMAREHLSAGTLRRRSLLRRCRQLHSGLSAGT